jgi:integrase
MQAFGHLALVASTPEMRTVAPMRRPNAKYRSREHLTEREVDKLIEAAKDNRWRIRDSTMILLAYRHGLRVSELVDLRWEQVDLENATLHVRRVKQGTPATQPLTGSAGAAQAQARGQIAICVYQRTRSTVYQPWLSGCGRAHCPSCRPRHKGPRAHAASCLRLQAG